MPESALAIYTNHDGQQVQIALTAGEVWISQETISEIFGVDRSVISKHIRGIFGSGELPEPSNVQKMHIATNGATKPTNHYSLDVVISVGYRVNSIHGTQFRTWATGHLSSLITQGFALDPNNSEAIDNLARRVRQIRVSEIELYRRVRDVFKAVAADYDPQSQAAKSFFAMAQDKFLFAVTGRTAAQLVIERVDSTKPRVGMLSFRGERPTIKDVTTAKNYLNDEELHGLENISEQFLLFAESKAFRRQPITMEEITTKLNMLLMANDYSVLYQYGSYERDQADAKAKAALGRYEGPPATRAIH